MVQSLLKRFAVHGVGWLAALLLVGYAQPTDAAKIVIDFTAMIDSVSDPENILSGAIQPGDTITGSYTYQSTMEDSNPAPTIGDYWHTKSPSGIIVYAGGFQWRTDPTNVRVLIEIGNDFDFGGETAEDFYVLHSYNNVSYPPLPQGAVMEILSWQLVDPTGAALSSAALPTTAPDLDAWPSDNPEQNSLVIASHEDIGPDEFFIWAHFTSMVQRK